MVDETETFTARLGDLRAFCAVIEFGTISAAAQHFGESKGGTSRRISRLERRLGVALLARTARAVTATEEGNAFYGKAREALALLADAFEAARQSRSVPRGRLRVTAPLDFGIDVLPALVVQFRRLHPQITVELLLTDALLDLAANRIDLALRATAATLPDTAYHASALAEFRLALYAAPDYLARHEAPDSPADLAGHDFVAFRAPAGALQLALEHRRGRRETATVRPAVHADDYASVHRIVRAGGGIGAIPDLIARPSVAGGELLPVLPGWAAGRAKLHAISIAGRDAPARVRIFREFLRTAFAADRHAA